MTTYQETVRESRKKGKRSPEASAVCCGERGILERYMGFVISNNKVVLYSKNILKQLEVRTMSSKKLCKKPLFYNKNIATYSAI